MINALKASFMSWNQLIPNGIIFFFSSFGKMEKFYNLWKVANFGKCIFKESQLKKEKESIINDYKKECKTNGGAILFTVKYDQFCYNL